MSTIKSYRDLEVWRKALDLTQSIYVITEKFHRNEEYGLKGQMRRAAVSIPSNIAEGHERNSSGEFLQFIGISRGSLAELETQMEIAARLQFLDHSEKDTLLKQCDEISRMLVGLMKALRSVPRSQSSIAPSP